jgi:lipoprotein-anchoring transpeptidase ErfK/SrfK
MSSLGKRIVKRRAFLSLLGIAAIGLPLTVQPAQAFIFQSEEEREERRKRRARNARKKKAEAEKARKAAARNKVNYKGRELVEFQSSEKPGTIIVKTGERALYQVMLDGKAMRYLVAVGKDGFSWSGVARVGMKRKNPTWTPPAEMIKRTPKYAKWKNGMPGGIPENPLGARALYLFDGSGDTMYRIHGTNAPSSIGTAASSGCIRMLNQEVVELFNNTPVGTKVIVKQ